MCGICGKFTFTLEATVFPATLKAMTNAIVHRGPDDEGYYFSGPVGLGFRRLSIIDLSTGHQPLCNEDRSVWIVFNGEIYNYVQLRQSLESKGHVFRTQTDTEVIVHLYEEFGDGCVDKLRGMFAFAVWDDRQRKLFIARDRVGIKPLYYYATNKGLLFGSEIKSILADPEVVPEITPAMVHRFLSFYYLPGDETLLRNIRKLPAGHYLVATSGSVQIKRYWDLDFSPRSRTMKQAEEELVNLLDESVRIHMISDVPVGFLLSGGVDSTAILSFAAGKTDRAISSYTVGFSDSTVVDERPYARLAAREFGTDHHEITIGPKEFQDFLPKYVWYMEEPVCEPPAVALFYVSRLARKFVKVLISGEGGDEAFAGYPNYRTLLWLERLKKVLGPVAPLTSSALSAVNAIARSKRIERYAPLFYIPFEQYYYSRTSGPYQFFNSKKENLYTSDFMAHLHKTVPLAPAIDCMERAPRDDQVNLMLYIDTKTWLPDDLLIKADKMTMANSVELRVPFLDHKLLEFAASLPGNYKVRGLETKYLAKKVLSTRVPRQILERKKTGFPVPYAEWMRTDLKDWVRDTLLDRNTVSRGYFRPGAVETLLAEHSRSGTFAKEVFSLAILELWHRTFLKNDFRESFGAPVSSSKTTTVCSGYHEAFDPKARETDKPSAHEQE